jgi:transposase
MSVSSDTFVTDPSVQFSTGGRTVSFTIPANGTQAVFSNGATTIKLQTGSVAGGITITPSFATRTGYSLTPDSPASLSLSIASAARASPSENPTVVRSDTTADPGRRRKAFRSESQQRTRVKANRSLMDFPPSYSPELNPIERGWKLTRRRCLRNHCFAKLENVIAGVESELGAGRNETTHRADYARLLRTVYSNIAK